jgi:pimeloyl-ACP methyl ester carboxylesterase
MLACASLTLGCGPRFGPKADFGIVFYSPGAGNVDFGDAGLRTGLEKAGFPGQVATNLWTVSFNPAIDQVLRVNAKLGGRKLARWIEQYIDEYPDRALDLVGLSAGTGVSIWALENLKDGYQVDNVVLLASSLSHDYDASKARRHMRGTLYNYYSSEDAVLAIPMKLFGTIDARFGVDGAGAVGLHPPGGEQQVVNIPWTNAYRKYGYNGGHTDGTSPAFVQAVLSKHIVRASEPKALSGEHATPTARRTPRAPRD